MKPIFDAFAEERRAAIAAMPREPAGHSHFPLPQQFDSSLIWRCTLLAVALFALANVFDGKPANAAANPPHNHRVQV